MNHHRTTSSLGARLAMLWLCVGVAGCTSTPQTKAPTAATEPPAGFPAEQYSDAAADNQRVYQVDPDASRLRIQVYRGGRLERLGHNHTVASRQVRGMVLVAEPMTDSRADLYVPVDSLVVDAPEDREAAGADFTKPVDAAATEGTRKNLLSPAVLYAEKYPYVLATIEVAGVRDQTLDLSLTLVIRGVSQRIPCTATLESESGRLRVRAALDIRQSDFGISPFSVLNGALTVQDRVELVLDITARPLAPGKTTDR